MVIIDKLAVVHEKAQIGANCQIGPFCTVGANVQIGDNTKLKSHVVADGHTTIGSDCEIFPFVTLGIDSQDLKHDSNSISYATIGDRNIIREFVSIHNGTEEGSTTSVGDDCALLAHAHVGHNCVVGNHVIFSHNALAAGHVIIGDHANIGALAAIHQFCHIGTAAMVAAMSRVIQDVLPFTIAEGFPAHMRVINKIGMQRAGYSDEEIAIVRKTFRKLFLRELRLDEAVAEARSSFPNDNNVTLMLEAIEASKRGLARPENATYEINVG